MSEVMSSVGSSVLARIIVVGNELLNGEVVDTNSRDICSCLLPLGIEVTGVSVVRDNLDEIGLAIHHSLEEAGLVVMTGGLGPTSDDITRDAVAAFMGVPLSRDALAEARLIEKLGRSGIASSKVNERQVYFPVGAQVIPNDFGTADAFCYATKGGALIVSLPGVPRELRGLLKERVLPIVETHFSLARCLEQRVFRVFGLPESEIGARIERLDLDQAITVAYRPIFPDVRVKLSSWMSTSSAMEQQAQQRQKMQKAVDGLCSVLGNYIYSKNDEERIAERVVQGLKERLWSLAVAESCTGGGVCDELVSVSGVSQVFRGAVVAYDNQVKTQILGVEAEVISQKGAVSSEVALAMARGVRKNFDADVGLATTGIAGPEGGTQEKPVGTIWIALSSPTFEGTWHFCIPRERNMFRRYFSFMALDLLRKELLEKN